MDTPKKDEPAAPEPGEAGGMDRRRFLTEAAGAAGVATVTYFWLEGLGEPARRRRIEPTDPAADPRHLTRAEWRTLEAACDRLLPTGADSPGARTVNAIGYLDAVLGEDHLTDGDKALIRGGAAKLDERARAAGAPDFAALPPEKQDAAVRVFETHRAADGTYPGHKWLKKMLSIVFEAFFGDPVHGGNPNEVAWKWAGHRPGFPRPTEPGWTMVERE
jgi:hypothetical protein